MPSGARLSIPTRIFLSFALVLTSFAAVSGFSLYRHQRTAQQLRLIDEAYLPLIVDLGDAKATQEVFDSFLEVLDEDGATVARTQIGIARRVRPNMVRLILDKVSDAESLALETTDRQDLARIRAHLLNVQAALDDGEVRYNALFRAYEGQRPAEAGMILEALRRDERRIAEEIRDAFGVVQDRMDDTSRRSAEEKQQSLFTMAFLVIVTLLAGLVVTWWSQRLLAPLPRLLRRVAAVAQGDLAARIEPTRDDELGLLTREFERMVDAVGARDRDLRDAAESLRELQRMQEQIVSDLRAAVVVVDGGGVVRSANPAAERVLGLAAAHVGRPLGDTDLPDRLAGLAEAIDDVADGSARAELPAAAFAGPTPEEERAIDVLVTPFGALDPDDSHRSVLLVADDVTQELRTKARLIQSERLAAIGRMAAHVTHEVRNPLSSIGLNVELLEDEVADAGPETQALLLAIQREIDRLTAVTEEYLRVARLPAPRLEPESLGALVTEIGRFVALEMESSGVRLDIDVDADLPLVAADESQIRQALLNLLRNARESMPEGGVVRLAALRDGSGVELIVADQGVGIPPEQQRHIFELFFSTKERGTGLGLSLTQQIVLAHGGRVTCETADGGGTVFRMAFPGLAPSEVPVARSA